MCANPRNAIMHLGHSNGTVTLWSPNVNTPLVKMLCHHAPVQALDIDVHGNHLVTSGLDGQVKVWDIRTYKEVHSYFTVRPASTLSISDMGLLALGYGSHVSVWKDALRVKQSAPYLREEFPGKTVHQVKFCPFEDVLAVSHDKGFASLVIPGAGEPNFDTFEANPFETKKQRREKTVVSLLEKLQPSMITLDENMFGLMNHGGREVLDSSRRAIREAKAEAEEYVEKNRKRGKSRSSKRYRRKRKNIVDQATEERTAKIKKFTAKKLRIKKEEERKLTGAPKSTLDRFTRTTLET
jgi:U3 small nucleolar RNA-associated protein 7